MNEKFILHSFFTQGYAHWAELFLESACKAFDKKAEIWLDTFNLDDVTKIYFEEKYPYVTFTHLYIPMSTIAKDLKLTEQEVNGLYQKVESGEVNSANYLLKVYISVHLRYRNVINQVRSAFNTEHLFFAHCDIDLYFRKSWQRLDITKRNFDLACLVRSDKNHLTNILGAFLLFKLNDNVISFLSIWDEEIQKVAPCDRWQGFGQSVLWAAYQRVRKEMDIWNIQDIKSVPFLSKTYEDSEIWLNSNNNISGIVKEQQSDVGRFISWVDLALSKQHHNPLVLKHHIKRKLYQFPSNKLLTEFIKD